MKTLFRSLWHVNSVQMESNSSGVESTTHPTGNALVQTRNITSFSSDPTIFSYELHMRQIHSEKGGFAVCEYCSKEFTGSIGKVKFALKEHIQVGRKIDNGAQMLNSCFRQYTWVSGKPATSVERPSSQILY